MTETLASTDATILQHPASSPTSNSILIERSSPETFPVATKGSVDDWSNTGTKDKLGDICGRLPNPSSTMSARDLHASRRHASPVLSEKGSEATLPGHRQTAPIAVCGLALRLPGGIHDANTFWTALLNGKDMRGPVPSSRYNAEGFLDAFPCPFGYFLDGNLAEFDTSFFNVRRSEAESSDPQQRQLLEVTRECLENAGETEYRGKTIGCYVGSFGEDWLHMACKDDQELENLNVGGTSDVMLANRISYELDLHGPSLVIKTGCSASMIALHEACRSLQSGDCDGAIVAGSNLIMTPIATKCLNMQGVLSADASSKTFDASANGYARGEAINAVFIKRLDDAIRDNNPIRAVIRATGTNSDGRGGGLLTPNGKAHEALMRTTYQRCGLDPQDTAFVECHGTGTPTGDPIETTAVGNVFGESGVLIGSVKPNVGHSEGASGITSLIKAILALENRIIPPNIKFNTPNPKIPFAKFGLKVPVSPMGFPRDRAERISINSYGIGGANAHAIVESYEYFSSNPNWRSVRKAHKSSSILLFSANSQNSLQKLITNHESYIKSSSANLSDLAYTLAFHREKLPFRAFAICQPGSKMTISAGTCLSSINRKVAMVFNGQGAQWPQMGYDLYTSDENFRKDISLMDDVLQSLQHRPAWSISSELQKPSSDSDINSAELAQPLSLAFQIAIVNFYARCNVFASAVVGHSSGEIAAAYASGNLSMREAIIIAYYRGYVMRENRLKGGMAAIGLSREEVVSHLLEGVSIACENSPTSVTISGEVEQLKQVMAAIKAQKPDAFIRELKVDTAYHSKLMNPLAERYLQLLREELGSNFSSGGFGVPMFSTVLKKQLDGSMALPIDYWCSNLMNTVLFNDAASMLMRAFPETLLLEVGPHSTLAGPLRAIGTQIGVTVPYVTSLTRNSSSSRDELLRALGNLYQNGVDIDWAAVIPVGKPLSDLPTYPWDRTAYWRESRISKEWRNRPNPSHPLLGQRVLETPSSEPAWRCNLSLEKEQWIRDHRVRGNAVFPFAAYLTMAAEAAKQESGIKEAYKFRHVVAHTALVIPEAKSVELYTSLRPHRQTDTSDSSWRDFTISSWNGTSWTEHCHGMVQATKAELQHSSDWTAPLPVINASKWYSFTKRIGLDFGPEFRSIDHIRASAKAPHVLGQIKIRDTQIGTAYPMHPCVLDGSLQLLLCAALKAKLTSRELAIPTMIESLYISHSSKALEAKAWVHDGKLQNGVECIEDGRTVISLRGMEFAKLPEMDDRQSALDRHAAAHLHWEPHIDFIKLGSLIQPRDANEFGVTIWEEAVLLCILDAAEKIKSLKPTTLHYEKYKKWIDIQVDLAKTGHYPLVKHSQRFAELPQVERAQQISTRLKTLSTIPLRVSPVEGLKRLSTNMADIFQGKIDPLELLMQDEVLTGVYNMCSMDCGLAVRALCHKKPNLRILEVGAGTGGTTANIFDVLFANGEARNHPPFSLYSFTDVSAGFFDKAQERFAGRPNMEYRTLDFNKDPIEQGFEKESYDLIVAANCVHVTPSLRSALENLRYLLKTDGYLLLSELCAASSAPGFLFGLFPGWWMGAEDKRELSPFVSIDRWDAELRSAGYSGISSTAYDYAAPHQLCATILTQPASNSLQTLDQSITILCSDSRSQIVHDLSHGLSSRGFDVKLANAGDDFDKSQQQFISVLDLEAPFFDEKGSNIQAYQKLVQTKDIKKLLWIMPPCQINCRNPDASRSLGMLRATRAELGVPLVNLEIDRDVENLCNVIIDLFLESKTETPDGGLVPDLEFAYDCGEMKTGRFHGFHLEEALLSSTESLPKNNTMIELEVKQRGLLDSLTWVEQPCRTLKKDEIEIESFAVGMNFRDLASALGIITVTSDRNTLGMEVSGVVRRVGSAVQSFAAGDRVVATANGGLFTSYAIVPSVLAAKIPESLSFEEATSLPVVFMTLIRALLEIGQLGENQTILIHSACGGIGQGAIQLAKLVGAKVFATVGTPEKVAYLVETFGIPRDHIFSSRDDSFVDGLMQATENRGADLVLNSLAGELLEASWKCVAEFGKLIELGKRDLLQYGKLNMEPFLANRTYSGVDTAHLLDKNPEAAGRLLKKCIEMYERGEIYPIRPIKTFHASQAQKAFRYLQKGTHIGKIVIQMPRDVSTVPKTPQVYSLSFDSQATYLITGGFGGLGRALMEWMTLKGARNFVAFSPTAGQRPEHEDFIAEMESQGCSVIPVAGLVQDEQDNARATAMAKTPIKGVIHLAMQLRNVSILEMGTSDWTEVINPKCRGALNLHNALQSESLDFFLLASSIVGHTESAGQSNYAAASTYLEAFCQYRHGLGLPASIISIPPIEDTGLLVDNPKMKDAVDIQGYESLTHYEFLDCCEFALRNGFPEPSAEEKSTWHNSSAVVLGLKTSKPLSDPSNKCPWRLDRRMGFYHNISTNKESQQDCTSDGDRLAAFLTRVREDKSILKTNEAVETLAIEIGRSIFSLALRDPEQLRLDLTPLDLGLDSLLAIELKRWWRQMFGREVSVLEITGAGSLLELGELAVRTLDKVLIIE